MRVVADGSNKIRDLVADNVTYADWGTGTTAAIDSDTGLETEIAGVDQSTTVGKSNKAVQLTAVLPSPDGNGSSVSEVGFFFSDDTMLGRTTFVAVSKTSDKSIHNISPVVFVGGN